MNGYLRQSTASQARLIGPFIDDTDFKTAKTALTIADTDIKLRANGTTLANKNSGGGTHQVNGMYSVTWDATDTANIGELHFSVVVSTALQVFGTYVVVEEAVYDALFAASAAGFGTPQTGDSFARLGAPAGASVSADIAAVKTETASIQSDTNDIQARLPAALISGRMSSDIGSINGVTGGVGGLDRSTRTIVLGTATTGGTTTSIPTSSLAPAASVTDQFKGRVVIFDEDTTTAGLRGAAAAITTSTSGGTLTVSPALPATPASGDTFAIL